MKMIKKMIRNFLSVLFISIFSLILTSPFAQADYLTYLGIIPYGPFPLDYTFIDIKEIKVSKDVTYMLNETIDYKNVLLVSFDNGKRWTPVYKGKNGEDFYAVDPSYPGRIYYYEDYYSESKLSRSDNYGKTWKDITPPYKYLYSIYISPSNPSTIYAYSGSWALYISTNYGDSWIDLRTSTRPVLKNIEIYRLYVDVNNPYRLYILGYLSSSYGGVGNSLYIYDLNLNDPSKDKLTIGGIGLSTTYYYYYLLRQNPEKPNEIWAFIEGKGCLYKSTDGGINFTKNLPDFCEEYTYQVKVSGSNVAISTNNGIKLSRDNGSVFSVLIGGSIRYMDTIDFKTFYYKKNDKFTYYDGTTEKSSGRATILSLSFDVSYIGGEKRTFRLNNSQYENFIDNLGMKRLEKLNNGYLLGYDGYSCYIISQNAYYYRHASCDDFYAIDYSKDFAYFTLYNEIKKIHVPTGNVIRSIYQSARQVAVSEDEQRMVISKSNTIYVSDNGGINFVQTALSDNNGIYDILIDRTNSNNVIVAGGSGLYYSRDGGKTFTQSFSGKFWNIRQLPSGLILVMSSGTFYESIDGGSTWNPVQYPPYYIIYDVTKINNSYFFATDYGVVEVPGAKSVSVLQPNGGQKWKAGSNYTIKWEAPLNSYNFNLRYSTDNKTTWANITTVLASNRCTSDGTKYTCTYGWTIPPQNGRKPQSFVRVSALNSSNQTIGSDDSDKPFSIEVLMVKSPNGGETLKVGTTYSITWETYALTRTVASVLLQYSTDGGSTWKNIKTLTGNPGQYSWIVPNTPSANCRVRVVLKDSTGSNIAIDASDKVFTIAP